MCRIFRGFFHTAKVEKYNNGEWTETTDLEETQKLQLNWYFIKNNDDQDREVLTDKLTDDELEIDGLTMKVVLQDDNIEQFAHAHCFVNSPEDEEEGYGLTELKRQLDVQEVLGRNLLDLNASEVNYRVELNIDNPTEDERKSLKVEIHEKDEIGKVTVKEAKVEDELTIKHTLDKKKEDEPKLVEIRAKVYPKEYPSNSAEGISYVRPLQLEGINTLNQFVFQETGSFYKESLPLKAESATLPVNAIFIRCMQFYNSDKLKKFVKYAQP